MCGVGESEDSVYVKLKKCPVSLSFAKQTNSRINCNVAGSLGGKLGVKLQF